MMADDMPVYPDPEQSPERDPERDPEGSPKGSPKQTPHSERDPERDPELDRELDRATLRELKVILDTIRREVSLLVLDRDSYRRERNMAMQALATEVCHDDGPSSIRMDPQKGLQGWCTDCETWHCWADWCGAGWGWTEDRDSPGGGPP